MIGLFCIKFLYLRKIGKGSTVPPFVKTDVKVKKSILFIFQLNTDNYIFITTDFLK